MDDKFAGNVGKEISEALGALIKSPASEFSELLADQIRYFRWRSLLRIARKAKEIRANSDLSHDAVPLKLLLPILEEGSKEDPDDPICDLWANLLARSSNTYGAFDLICVDILKKLSKREAEILIQLRDVADAEVIQKALRSRVPEICPESVKAIQRAKRFGQKVPDEHGLAYSESVLDVLEENFSYTFSSFYSRWHKNYRSSNLPKDSEELYALRTLRLVQNGPRIHMNPDFSKAQLASRSGPGDDWQSLNCTVGISMYSLTPIGEQFLSKVISPEPVP